MSKRPRTLDGFFNKPPTKKPKNATNPEVVTTAGEGEIEDEKNSQVNDEEHSQHASYPFSVPHLPPLLQDLLNFVPATEAREINNQPDLDLLQYSPFIPKDAQRGLFEFLRRELFFYRVKYKIKRGITETLINTPRFTTVFGIDETARFKDGEPVHTASGSPLPKDTYKCTPRPLPQCLDLLRSLTENVTGCKYNFCLVNYYATGDDSISYHSDDERFLGPNPAIASFTLGESRDFLLKHKPTPEKHESESKPMKFPLTSGDMILMRGKTQSNWLHSIPKRKNAGAGRINITFRRAMVKGGTENYYRYNVVGDGGGDVYKWNPDRREMAIWGPE